MVAPVRPTNKTLPFAYSGTKNTIPTASTGTGKASLTDGFPAVTMLPISAGGIPPEGKDFNGILFDITTMTLWLGAGGQFLFDATLAAAIGGYPVGMVLQSNDFLSSYINVSAANSTDFNATPSSIGSTWMPWAGAAFASTAVATTGGTTNLTATQATAEVITVTGVLVSNATISVPAKRGAWDIVNSTTGVFTLSVIVLGGTGVIVNRGGVTGVISDGINMSFSTLDVATQSPGDNTTKAASTAFVTAALAAGTAKITPVVRSTNTIMGAADAGKLFQFTSGFTQTYSACATLTSGWFAYFQMLPGANAVVNGDFSSGTGWTLSAGSVTISGGVLNFTAAAAAANATATPVPLTVGKQYQVNYTVGGYSSGNAQIKLGSAAGTARTANGTYSEIITCAGTGDLIILNSSGTGNFTIDNVTCYEVGAQVTHDPNASETIGGALTAVQNVGDVWLVVCDGSNLTLERLDGAFTNRTLINSGTGNYTVPAGVYDLYAEINGAGGGVNATTGGGAGGAYAAGWVSVYPGQLIPYAVGAGSSGLGGTTTFGTFSATGGGTALGNNSCADGGLATGGTINLSGGDGDAGGGKFGVHGGESPFGGASIGADLAAGGLAGNFPGGGAASQNSGTASGASGQIRISYV